MYVLLSCQLLCCCDDFKQGWSDALNISGVVHVSAVVVDNCSIFAVFDLMYDKCMECRRLGAPRFRQERHTHGLLFELLCLPGGWEIQLLRSFCRAGFMANCPRRCKS